MQPDASHNATAYAPRASLRKHLRLADFEVTARQRLPRQIYGFYAGGSEELRGIRDNSLAYDALSLVPRVLLDVSRRSTQTTLFGTTYALPVGICPMGLAGLSTFQGDLALTRGAAAGNIPMVVSGASIEPLETQAAAGATWFQAYLSAEQSEVEAMLARVAAAGYRVLVVTVDAPVLASRENDVRTGFSIPLHPSLRLLWDGISHPKWSLGTFARTFAKGMPRFSNMSSQGGPPLLSRDVMKASDSRARLNWNDFSSVRKLWQGPLVVKGLLAAEDALEAQQRGADAVWLSNHGGRQLDGAIPPLRVLPEIAARTGAMKIFIDGGIRRGTDIVKALALGADFVFIGRPFLYAAATAGSNGVRHAVHLLHEELRRNLALLGVNRTDELTPRHVRDTASFGFAPTTHDKT